LLVVLAGENGGNGKDKKNMKNGEKTLEITDETL